MLQLLNFKDFWSEIGRAVMSFNSISDVLDVILVTFVIYSAIKLIRETKAVQLAKGFILLLIVYALVNLFGMQASNYILSLVFNNLLLVLVIIFTPEIRHALESVGRSSVSKFNFFGFRSGAEEKRREEMQKMVNAVCRASSDMSDKHIGALMVFEQETILGDIISSGTVIDAKVSPEMIGNIFYPGAPLHDGAAVFRSELGTRHRASIGMSEQSDAVIVVVSEETGAISVAYKGRLRRGISDGDLREILMEHFVKPEEDEGNSKIKKWLKGRRTHEQK